MVVAVQHRASRRWRDGLRRASASARVGAIVRGIALVRDGSIDQTEVLGVAVGHAYDSGMDGQQLAARLLPAFAALRAEPGA